MMVCSLHHYATGTLMAHNAACHASIHRENSPVTQTTPEPTLFSWVDHAKNLFLPPPRYSNHPRAHTVVLGRLTTRTHPPNTAPTPPHTPTAPPTPREKSLPPPPPPRYSNHPRAHTVVLGRLTTRTPPPPPPPPPTPHPTPPPPPPPPPYVTNPKERRIWICDYSNTTIMSFLVSHHFTGPLAKNSSMYVWVMLKTDVIKPLFWMRSVHVPLPSMHLFVPL